MDFPTMDDVNFECDGNDDETVLKLGSSTGYTSPLTDYSEREAYDLYTRRETPSVGGKWPRRNPKKETEEEKPYSRPVESRRKFLEDNADLPKELKELFSPLKCNLCNCEMSSPITAKCHYSGKKHIANIKKWFAEHPDFTGKYKIPEFNRNASADPEKLYCKYCDLTLSSDQQAEAHYAGKKHQDVINNKTMKNAFFNTKTDQWERCETAKEDKTGRFGIGLAFLKPSAEVEDPKPVEQSGHRFFCETCRIACPSQISLNDHLAGAKHKKRTAALTRDVPPPGDEIIESRSEEDSKNVCSVNAEKKRRENKNFESASENGARSKRKRENLEKIDLRCKVCKKTLPDVSSLVRHLRESKNHSNNLRSSSGKYTCASCEKTFSGKDSMIDHLTSMAHEVVVAQNIFDYRFDRKMTETLDCSYCDFDAAEMDQAIFHFLSDPHERRLTTPDVAVEGTLVSPLAASSDSESTFRVRIAPKIIDAGAFYFCSVCNLKIFGGKSHLLKHLKGFGHSAILRDPGFEMKIYLDYGMSDCDPVNKAAKDNILETVIKSDKKSTSPSDLSIFRTPSGNYYCQPCDVTVNSQAQFVQHSESKKHKHKISSAAVKPK